MSYSINPVGEDRCVFLSYEGEVPAVELSAARYEADAILDQRQWHRLIVDVTQLQSMPRTAELIDFAGGLSATVSRARRVGLVVRPEQDRLARLIQKLARRGRLFLASFLDPAKAIRWVKQSTPARQKLGRNQKEQLAS